MVWNIFFSIYWESSSQVTFIFFRGVGSTTNQINSPRYQHPDSETCSVSSVATCDKNLRPGFRWRPRSWSIRRSESRSSQRSGTWARHHMTCVFWTSKTCHVGPGYVGVQIHSKLTVCYGNYVGWFTDINPLPSTWGFPVRKLLKYQRVAATTLKLTSHSWVDWCSASWSPGLILSV